MAAVPSSNQTDSQVTRGLRRFWRSISVPLVAVLLGALIGAILLLISGANPIEAYSALIKARLARRSPFSERWKNPPHLYSAA